MSNENASNKIIERTIHINASLSGVWKILTQSEMMKQWLFDSDIEVISDWKAGSPILFRGKFHGKKFEDRGKILQFVPEKILQYTYWSWISNLPDIPENYIITTFELEAKLPNQTLLKLTQTNFVAKASYEHWNFYWNVTLGVLKRTVEGGGIV